MKKKETPVRYHYTPVRMAKIQNIDNTKYWWGCGAMGTLISYWWEHKTVQPLWKTVWCFLTKLNIFLPFDSTIMLFGIYPKELKTYVHMETCTQMFFVFVFVLFIYLFIYLFWLCWVFVSVRRLSLVAASGGHSSSQCVGLSLSWPLLLRSTGSRCAGSVVVAHGPSCSAACGILPDQGSNPCPLH